MGKSNSVVNIDENEIFFEMEDDGILGYLPIAKKTQTGIFSQVVSVESMHLQIKWNRSRKQMR